MTDDLLGGRRWRVECGDVLEVLGDVPDNTYDGCFCDPPYGLSFMGKKWDHAVPGPDYWAEVLRVLKPGAMLLAFGGTRTWHRLACAIEDAGFELRDTLMWLHGQGFPKSTSISKQLDKQERNRWLKICKALDKLDSSAIIKAWNTYSETVKSAGVRFEKNGIEAGISMQKSDSVPVNVMLPANLEKYNVSAINAELNLSEVRHLCAAEPTVLRNVGAGAQQSRVKSAENQLRNGIAKSMPTGTVQCDAKESPSESMVVKPKAVEALKTWLGSKKSSKEEAISALCAALTNDLKRTILSRSKTFQNLDTTQQTALVSATSVTITESTAVLLISFTANMLRNEALDKAAGAERGQGPIKRGGERLMAQAPGGKRDGRGTWGDEVGRDPYTSLPATSAAKVWDGYGTGLKPAWEPVLLAMKPLDGTFAHNALRWHVAGLNVDGSRIESHGDVADTSISHKVSEGWDRPWRHREEDSQRIYAAKVEGNRKARSMGRWPANLLLSHLPECERRGTKRVRPREGHRPNPVEKQADGQIQFNQKEPGFQKTSYTDPDGLEEVDDWECAEGCVIAEIGDTARFFRCFAEDRNSWYNIEDTIAYTMKGCPACGDRNDEVTLFSVGENQEVARFTQNPNTFIFGKKSTEQSQRASLSTIATDSEKTIESKTLNSSAEQCTLSITHQMLDSETDNGSVIALCVNCGSQWVISIAEDQLADNDTVNSVREISEESGPSTTENIITPTCENTPNDSAEPPNRWFYCAKASRRERDAGLEGMPANVWRPSYKSQRWLQGPPKSKGGGWKNGRDAQSPSNVQAPKIMRIPLPPHPATSRVPRQGATASALRGRDERGDWGRACGLAEYHRHRACGGILRDRRGAHDLVGMGRRNAGKGYARPPRHSQDEQQEGQREARVTG